MVGWRGVLALWMVEFLHQLGPLCDCKSWAVRYIGWCKLSFIHRNTI